MPVTVKERIEERYERKSIGGIGEQGEVGDELVFGRELKIVSGLGLPVVHGVFLHAHERGIGIGINNAYREIVFRYIFVRFSRKNRLSLLL